MRQTNGKLIGNIIAYLVALMLGGSGVAILLGVDKVTAGLIAMGVGDYLKLLGVMHIVFVALYIYPGTLKLGFTLLCCYLGGAMATELSHHQPLDAAVLMALVWVSAYLRNKMIFMNSGTM